MFEENENNYPCKTGIHSRSFWTESLDVLNNNRRSLYTVRKLYSGHLYCAFGTFRCLFIHELGHYSMMRIYGVKAQGMFLMSLFGNEAKKLRYSTSQKEQVLINLMGPLPGILAGVALFLVAQNSGNPNIYLVEVALLLLAVNVLNIVPLDPFDGGRIMEVFFFFKSDQHKMVFTLVSSLVLILVGVLLWFWPLIIFGFIMGLKVRGFQKKQRGT